MLSTSIASSITYQQDLSRFNTFALSSKAKQYIDLKEKIVSFDCLNKDNKMSYCNLFSKSELENSILEKIEIRKMKSLKNEVMLITESLKLSFSLLIILDDLFN